MAEAEQQDDLVPIKLQLEDDICQRILNHHNRPSLNFATNNQEIISFITYGGQRHSSNTLSIEMHTLYSGLNQSSSTRHIADIDQNQLKTRDSSDVLFGIQWFEDKGSSKYDDVYVMFDLNKQGLIDINRQSSSDHADISLNPAEQSFVLSNLECNYNQENQEIMFDCRCILK